MFRKSWERGGWAAIINNDGGYVKKISGNEKNTTNNRMELMAPINALKEIDPIKKLKFIQTLNM